MPNKSINCDIDIVSWHEAAEALRAIRDTVFIVEQKVDREEEFDGLDDLDSRKPPAQPWTVPPGGPDSRPSAHDPQAGLKKPDSSQRAS